MNYRAPADHDGEKRDIRRFEVGSMTIKPASQT
jgi:hypothetical protein